MHLYETLAVKVTDWRQNKYFHDPYPAISEIIQWAVNPDVSSFRLRQPQLRALETYWYLRLVENTSHIFDLYTQCFALPTDRLKAMGMNHPDMLGLVANYGFDGLVQRVKEDDEFVRQYKLEAVRETLTLDYPSYIFALAMGAGKTVLIGAIFAAEFAMAQEYPDQRFVENALVFAPGKTIIESLRELAIRIRHRCNTNTSEGNKPASSRVLGSCTDCTAKANVTEVAIGSTVGAVGRTSAVIDINVAGPAAQYL